MQAILTKYMGPTGSRGGRIIAKADAGRVIVPWDHGVGTYENHEAAAYAFCRKKGWSGRLAGGSIGNGYVWVFVSSSSRDRSRRRR